MIQLGPTLWGGMTFYKVIIWFVFFTRPFVKTYFIVPEYTIFLKMKCPRVENVYYLKIQGSSDMNFYNNNAVFG